MTQELVTAKWSNREIYVFGVVFVRQYWNKDAWKLISEQKK